MQSRALEILAERLEALDPALTKRYRRAKERYERTRSDLADVRASLSRHEAGKEGAPNYVSWLEGAHEFQRQEAILIEAIALAKPEFDSAESGIRQGLRRQFWKELESVAEKRRELKLRYKEDAERIPADNQALQAVDGWLREWASGGGGR